MIIHLVSYAQEPVPTIVTFGNLHVSSARVGTLLGTAMHDVALPNATVALDTAPKGDPDDRREPALARRLPDRSTPRSLPRTPGWPQCSPLGSSTEARSQKWRVSPGPIVIADPFATASGSPFVG